VEKRKNSFDLTGMTKSQGIILERNKMTINLDGRRVTVVLLEPSLYDLFFRINREADKILQRFIKKYLMKQL